ncbi:unnamed protein product [Lampetra planeri]
MKTTTRGATRLSLSLPPLSLHEEQLGPCGEGPGLGSHRGGREPGCVLRGRGGRLLAGLARFRDEFKVVGDVHGKGLMIVVELVTDKASRTPLTAAQMNELWEDCREMSLFIGKGGVYGQATGTSEMGMTERDGTHDSTADKNKCLDLGKVIAT